MDVGMEYEILMLQLGSLARKLFNAEENLTKYQEALEKATATLEKENRDLERLRNDSFSNTLLKLFGNFDRRYDKEYREIIGAKVEFDKAYAMKIAAARRVKEVEADIEEKKLRLRNIKEDVLRKHPNMNQVVSERQQQILAIQHEWRETNEAEQAGIAVLESLSDIISGLDAADAISTWDLITDSSLILDFLKHDKLDAAEASLAASRTDRLYFCTGTARLGFRLRERPRDHLLHPARPGHLLRQPLLRLGNKSYY